MAGAESQRHNSPVGSVGANSRAMGPLFEEIVLRRSSSEPFSSSAWRAILSIVMVGVFGCVLDFAT